MPRTKIMMAIILLFATNIFSNELIIPKSWELVKENKDARRFKLKNMRLIVSKAPSRPANLQKDLINVLRIQKEKQMTELKGRLLNFKVLENNESRLLIESRLELQNEIRFELFSFIWCNQDSYQVYSVLKNKGELSFAKESTKKVLCQNK